LAEDYGRDRAAVASGHHERSADRFEGFNTKDTKEEKARFARWKFVQGWGDQPGAMRSFVCFSSFVSFVFRLATTAAALLFGPVPRLLIAA
jgi:hypothetical protein